MKNNVVNQNIIRKYYLCYGLIEFVFMCSVFSILYFLKLESMYIFGILFSWLIVLCFDMSLQRRLILKTDNELKLFILVFVKYMVILIIQLIPITILSFLIIMLINKLISLKGIYIWIGTVVLLLSLIIVFIWLLRLTYISNIVACENKKTPKKSIKESIYLVKKYKWISIIVLLQFIDSIVIILYLIYCPEKNTREIICLSLSAFLLLIAIRIARIITYTKEINLHLTTAST